MNALLASVGFVVLAEMGDKTQLLAMALACRFRWQTVMLGVFAATLANHLLAVLAGTYLTRVVPLDYVRIAAFASFILFGFWTLRGDRLEGEDRRFNFSPFWTVFAAFFLAEMGDKTQLATVALAAEYQSVWAVWLGTTTGMMIADAVGIGVGVVLGKKIPERTIKWIAAFIFIFFGLSGLSKLLPDIYWYPVFILSGAAVLGFAVYGFTRGREKAPVMPAPYCEPGENFQYSPDISPAASAKSARK